jgi:hypothetical protein
MVSAAAAETPSRDVLAKKYHKVAWGIVNLNKWVPDEAKTCQTCSKQQLAMLSASQWCLCKCETSGYYFARLIDLRISPCHCFSHQPHGGEKTHHRDTKMENFHFEVNYFAKMILYII